MDRDYTVRHNGFQRAGRVISVRNKFVITRCNKARYKVRQKGLMREIGWLITQGSKGRSQSRNNVALKSVTKKYYKVKHVGLRKTLDHLDLP